VKEALMGVYYLLKDGDLVFQEIHQELQGAVEVWPIRADDRFDFYRLLVEAAAMGAKPERIEELMIKWNVVNADGVEFANRIGVPLWADDKANGVVWFAAAEDRRDLAFGKTAFLALVDLYRKNMDVVEDEALAAEGVQ
jgi:hypothetical protein